MQSFMIMALNSIRRAFIQSIAEIVERNLDGIINDHCDIEKHIIDHLPSILEQITEDEIKVQLKKYITMDPYYSANSLPLPVYVTAFGLSPPQEYDEHDVDEFLQDIFHAKCVEMKLKTRKTALPAFIAK